MPLILVVDDLAIIREPIAAALRAGGCEATCAVSGEDALLKLRIACPDLVLLDVSMPGMDGIAVLRGMRSDAATAAIPVILLTGSNDKAMILEAARLGVRDCMLKSGYTTEGLLSRVKKYVELSLTPGTASASPAFVNPKLPGSDLASTTVIASSPGSASKFTKAQIAKGIQAADIKTVSAAVSQLMTLASSPRATLSDIARCLKLDPGLSARILTISNSAAFATGRHKIAVIEDAVRQIGLSAIQKLAASMGIIEPIENGPDHADCVRRWQHSLAVATIMEKLAQQGPACVPGVAYMVGLCHELPDIILQRHFPYAYREAIAAAKCSGRCRRDELADRFGVPFYELASMIYSRLSLPLPILSPLMDFTKPGVENQTNLGSSNLSRLLNIANLCAHALLLSPTPDEIVRPLHPRECSDTIGAETASLDLDAIRAEVVVACGMLLQNSKYLNTSSYAPRPISVLYLCDDVGTGLDPLRIVLQHLVTDLIVRTTDSLAPDSWSDINVIVVASGNHTTANVVAAFASSHASVPILYLTSECPSLLASPAALQCHAKSITTGQLQQFLHRASAGDSELAA